MRTRISQVIQTLPMVYPYSRLFQLLLDYGLKSKVAKTRQGALDELASILRKSGISACDPAKAFPLIAAMIADKDSQVRKSALSVLRLIHALCCKQSVDTIVAKVTFLLAIRHGYWWAHCLPRRKHSWKKD